MSTAPASSSQSALPMAAVAALHAGWHLRRLRRAAIHESNDDAVRHEANEMRQFCDWGEGGESLVPLDIDDAVRACRHYVAEIQGSLADQPSIGESCRLLDTRLTEFRTAFAKWWRRAIAEGTADFCDEHEIPVESTEWVNPDDDVPFGAGTDGPGRARDATDTADSRRDEHAPQTAVGASAEGPRHILKVAKSVPPPCPGPPWDQVESAATGLGAALPPFLRVAFQIGTLLGQVVYYNLPDLPDDEYSLPFLRWEVPRQLRTLLAQLPKTIAGIQTSLGFDSLGHREIEDRCTRLFKELSQSFGGEPSSQISPNDTDEPVKVNEDVACPSLGLVLKPNGFLRRDGFSPQKPVSVTGSRMRPVLETLMRANGGWCRRADINACWPVGSPPSDNAREQMISTLKNRLEEFKVLIDSRGSNEDLEYRLCHAWTKSASKEPAPTVDDTKAFMRRLADYAVKHHMKQDDSPQSGMIYEYCLVADRTPGQWFQRELGSTMGDGAWFAYAMVNAFRATGDAYYRDVLTKHQLPFYLKMLNHGHELFTSERNDADPNERDRWKDSRELLLQGQETGFVPYWWDDGASASLDRMHRQNPVGFLPCRDELAGQAYREYRLSGYSLGSSNRQAEAVACMLAAAWRLLKDSDIAAGVPLENEVAQAARNLQECRVRHGAPAIPAVLAADSLGNHAAVNFRRIREASWERVLKSMGHDVHQALAGRPNSPQRIRTPGRADGLLTSYYANLIRSAALTEPMAFRLISWPYTATKVFDAYYDDGPRPPGINRFDLYEFHYSDGRPEHSRSQRKGPFKGPVPVGSRMGPQVMICCGWALQALRAFPDLWEHGLAEARSRQIDLKGLGLVNDSGALLTREVITKWHERELGGGLRTWEAIFDEFGYIPAGIGCGYAFETTKWDAFSHAGGYAHLINAAAQWILHLEGRNDWDLHRVPPIAK